MPSVVYVTGSESKETAIAIAHAMKKGGYSPVIINRDIAASAPKGIVAFVDPAVAEDHARVNVKPVVIRV